MGAGGAGEPCGAGGALQGRKSQRRLEATARGCPPHVLMGGGGDGSTFPTPRLTGPSSTKPPQSARRSSAGRFQGLGLLGPSAEEGRVPSVVGGGGGVHQRDAGRAEAGSAWEAGRACPIQEDGAAAPAHRSSGRSTWRPGATRGGTLGQRGPAERSVCASWPARQQRVMP